MKIGKCIVGTRSTVSLLVLLTIFFAVAGRASGSWDVYSWLGNICRRTWRAFLGDRRECYIDRNGAQKR